MKSLKHFPSEIFHYTKHAQSYWEPKKINPQVSRKQVEYQSKLCQGRMDEIQSLDNRSCLQAQDLIFCPGYGDLINVSEKSRDISFTPCPY